MDNDITLLNLSTNFSKLLELVLINWAWMEEAYWRWMHYLILDNINVIWEYLDNSKEVKYLKNSFVWLFEILELNNDKVIFLDINTWKKIEIIWEWEWSEFSLDKDFSVWDLIISRLIHLEDWWYNMKNYYFIKKVDNSDELLLAYKHMFNWINDVLDIEERMNMINNYNNWNENLWNNINYLKRIKWILLLAF